MMPVKLCHDLLWVLIFVVLIVVVYVSHSNGHDIMTFWWIMITCGALVTWALWRISHMSESEK